MPSKLIYLPIEAYQSRSTEYMSVKGGVYESCFQEAGIDFEAIRPWSEVNEIQQGIVVDYVTRSRWGFKQVLQLLESLSQSQLDPEEHVIFIEDFWTPGFEMIPYAQSLKYGYDVSKHVPVYSFCHAQSTDPYDFTARMSYWMRSMEKGWADYQSGIVCASKEMIQQWLRGGLPSSKLNLCGLSFNAKAMRRMFNVPEVVPTKRAPQVVFSSRWDSEKNPDYFLAVAEHYATYRPEVEFIVCTGLDNLTSNDPDLLTRLAEYCRRFKNLRVWTGLSKQQYFEVLRTAKVQFNCASQDFVSYTLLDAMLNGCAPLYPDILTFPDALNHSDKNLYHSHNSFKSTSHIGIKDCVKKLDALLDAEWEDYSWIYKKYESSTKRKLRAMGFNQFADVPQLSWLNSLTVEALKAYQSEHESA